MKLDYKPSRGPRMGEREKREKAQFNIRMDRELLDRYRDYCQRNGLDPQRQVINFIERVVDAEFDFQEKLWTILTEGG